MTLVYARSIALLMAFALAGAAWLRARERPWEIRILGILLALAFAVEVFGFITLLNGVNNAPVYNAFVIAEFVLVLAMLKAFAPRRLLIALGVAGLAAMGWSLQAKGTPLLLLTGGILILSLILSGLLLSALWQLSQRVDTRIQDDPRFWLFVGMLLYFGMLVPVIGASDFLSADGALVTALWTILPFVSIARYLFAAYACWQLRPAKAKRP